MCRKLVEIPAPPFLKKFVEGKYGIGFLLSERILLIEETNQSRWVGKWIDLERRYKHSFIKIEMHSPSPRRMLAIKRYFEREFYNDFFLVVRTKEKLDLEVMDSIRSFMKEYRLTEDDYSLTTLYRLYFRFKKKRVKTSKSKKNDYTYSNQ